MPTLYRIARWDEIYENNKSRVIARLRAVQIPNSHDGERFAYLMAEPNAAELYAAWLLILQVASRCHPRGTLVRDNGQPHDARSLAIKTRGRVEWFEAALPYFASNGNEHQSGWLEVVAAQAHGTTVPDAWHPGAAQVPPSVVLDSVVLNSLKPGGTEVPDKKAEPPPAPPPAPEATIARGGVDREKARPLPPNLDVPAFRTAWEQWIEHLTHERRGRLPSFQTLDIHLEKFRRWGAAYAIRAIDHSISRRFCDPELPKPPRTTLDESSLTPAQRELLAS